ncbi:universal stress protein [Paractinoplanes hotanensis]|uniref:Universal stress protein n=1 Tax=Paractinoplanes hotanensis TaxID=2906497 RepID=A0ABT0YE76_9ACTN|nr:universal stress protein [Actinoplanes hotanensis]MCM4084351.1 universal stress protein [Actinoplanes hotanensis]
MTTNNRTVLVGTDGSPAARAAVRWAADEAHRRNTVLTILYAFTPEWVVDDNLPERRYVDLGAEHAEVVLADAEMDAHGVSADLEVRRMAVAGSPASLLLEAARSAAVAVVGHRGHGAFEDLLLGSVGQAVAAHAGCPVAVVRGRADLSSGPVLVGVDPSPAGSHAVELAFDQAGSRGCGLVALRAFRSPAPPWGADIAPSVVHLEEQLDLERRLLDEVLQPWRTKYPQVPVETRMSRFDAARALIEASCGAQLLVAGSRGSGHLAGNLFGSVSLHLLRHAACPVLVAHA